MKIAILTHPLISNYGGILQAYALSAYLRRNGHDVMILNRQSNMPYINRLIKSLLIFIHHPRYNNPRYKFLAQFVKRNIDYSKPLWTTRDLNTFVDSNNFDIVIVGSDQVWRSDFAMNYEYNYFLDFVPTKIKKVSYAASFGLSNWKYTNEQTKRIRELIKEFTAISVREDEGVELCYDNLNINACHVLDPTMLLRDKDYDKIISKRIISENYIFVYWLGSEEEKKKALSNTHIDNRRIVDISLRGSEVLMSIEDWLSYIKYADIVITDSYHGCVFSLLFHKKISLNRNDSGGNGRIDSLFRMLSIEKNTEELDYTIVESALERERTKSYNFIKRAIQ